MRWGIIIATSLLLGACGSTNTRGSWSCSAQAGTSCSPIEAIDRGVTQATATPGIESGAQPLRWWEPQPFVFSADAAARREGDQVIRIVFAPWVDGQGDYHERSEVRAVMRRGGWSLPQPGTVQASEALRNVGRNAVRAGE